MEVYDTLYKPKKTEIIKKKIEQRQSLKIIRKGLG